MSEIVPLGDVLQQSESTFGFSGAILQLLQALRQGEVIGICSEFYGLNASAFSGATFPDEAFDLALPTAFWAVQTWQNAS